jgi:hypothetical protein
MNFIKIKNVDRIYKDSEILVYVNIVIQVAEARAQLKPAYLLVKV